MSRACEASRDDMLSALITRKPRDPVDSAHRLDLRFQLAAARADYLHVAMNSATGPMGTRDYEIRLEAAPIDAQRTFIHLSYAYTLRTMARFAMDAYLSGSGRDRFGFTVVERRADGSPVYIDGVRGVVERAAMRYYLGVEAYVDSPSLEQRLRRWYTATMRYPQLRETVGPDEYLEMKRRESRRSWPGRRARGLRPRRFSLLEHVRAVGERERETGHLVHQEDGRRFGAQTVEHGEEVVHHLRRESERRLIEQQ